MRLSLLVFSLVTALNSSAMRNSPFVPGNEDATVTVEASRTSGIILVSVTNHRKIGNVVLEVRNAEGAMLYKEEGKAMTSELVRRLDKGLFPKGPMTLSVKARDFAITQRFSIE